MLSLCACVCLADFHAGRRTLERSLQLSLRLGNWKFAQAWFWWLPFGHECHHVGTCNGRGPADRLSDSRAMLGAEVHLPTIWLVVGEHTSSGREHIGSDHCTVCMTQSCYCRYLAQCLLSLHPSPAAVCREEEREDFVVVLYCFGHVSELLVGIYVLLLTVSHSHCLLMY